MKIAVSKNVYDFETSADNRTIYITREDGATAVFHDDENIIDDWREWMIENITEGNIVFRTD